MNHKLTFLLLAVSLFSCTMEKELKLNVFETSSSGNKLTEIKEFQTQGNFSGIVLQPSITYQKITGFGGSFTESSAYLLNQLSQENRQKILEAYFGSEGARYSLTRTHINSCDFSLGQYAYVLNDDKDLSTFSIDEDREDIVPMIKDAMKISEDGFKIISSPWTAPPFMKDNKDWVGGKLLPEYYSSWALYFSKYIDAYKAEGIDIWGITVENEPLGNGNNWESMHFTPEEMVSFVNNHLGPKLEKDGHKVKLLGYDQNRDELEEWASVMYKNEESSKYFDGIAIHWYASTFKWYPDVLQKVHGMAPDKLLIETEGCIDAEVPVWKDDDWYWSKEATDWGYTWAENKADHPKYVPTFRYARDIIGCLNNWVDGWVDWNMVLDKQGGPNWFKNWCVAPVIVDPEKDEVYITPLYYAMAHFSRYIRPGAVRIGFETTDDELMVTAAQNPDGSMVVVVFNQHDDSKSYKLTFNEKIRELSISPKAIQTIVIPPNP